MQALGDGDRSKMRTEQQRQAEGMQLYLILDCIQEMLPLFPPALTSGQIRAPSLELILQTAI